MRFFRYSFVCLHCVVSETMHYRLCLVKTHMKVLQNGKLIRFSKRTDCWCEFSWSLCNQNRHFIRCIRATASKVMRAYEIHGKTSSGKRNSGWKPKLSESTLKRIVFENHLTTAAKVTAKLIIHLEDLFPSQWYNFSMEGGREGGREGERERERERPRAHAHTHKHTLSLSLSHIHTHTHTHTHTQIHRLTWVSCCAGTYQCV